MTEDEMAGWYHLLNGYKLEQALGDGKGQGSRASCSPWGHKELNVTDQLNNKIKKKKKICVLYTFTVYVWIILLC